MRKRFFWAVLFVTVAAALCLTACGKDTAGEWKDVETEYGTQGFQCEPDAAMTIDGYLDEADWNGRAVFEHTEAEVTIRMKAFYTVKGMYFGMSSRDYNIVYYKPYGLQNSYNSGFVLAVAAEGDTQLINKFSVGFDAGNTPRAYGLYNYKARATVQGEGVNTGNSDGMTVEAFVPWENIGLSVDSEEDVPDNIRVAIQYNVVPGEGSTGTWIYPGLSDNTTYGKYYKFDRNGYCDVDRDVYILGDAADGYAKSTEFDFSEAENGVYGTHRPGDRTTIANRKNIFVRNAYAESFVFTVKVTPQLLGGTAVIGNESNPGVYLFGQTNYGLHGFGMDTSDDSVNSDTVRLKTAQYISRTWTRPTNANAIFAETTEYSVTDGVPLTLIKDGDTYYYILGTPEYGRFIGYEKNVIHAGPACPGILTSNTAALLSDIRYKAYPATDTGRAEMTALLESLGICRVTAEVAGAGRATLSQEVVSNGDSVSVSFAATNGRYALTGFAVTQNGQTTEHIADVRMSAEKGTFTLSGVTADTTVRLTYAETDYNTVTFRFDTADGGRYAQLLVTAENRTDKSKYYEYRTSSATLPAALPTGEYDVTVVAGGYTTLRTTVTVAADAEQPITLVAAPFGGTVEVNGRSLASSSAWDYADNDRGIASRPLTAPQNDTAWMTTPASGDFTLTAQFTVTDTTDPDPNGGFMVSDGVNSYGIFLLHNGVRVLDTAGSNGGWQNRGYSAFSSGVGGKLAGKTVTLTLSRTNGVYSFTAAYGTATFTQTFESLRYTWNGGGGAFSLPSDTVAVGFASATGSAVTYSSISLTIQ